MSSSRQRSRVRRFEPADEQTAHPTSGPRRRPHELPESSVIRGNSRRTTHVNCPPRIPVRFRVLKVYDACNQRTAIRFIDEVMRRLPFRVHVIQSDNGAEFQSQFHWHVESPDIRHVYIRPRSPHLNGKVERSHRIDDQQFYQLLDKDGITDDIHLCNEKLREWEDYYNYHRPHGALDGQTPTSV